MLMRWGWPWPLAIGAILLIAIAIGVFHGFLVTKMNLQSFIVTLCGLLFYRGLARYIAEDQTLGFGYCTGFETLQKLTTGEVLGVPMPFVLLIIIGFIMWVVLHRSVYGRYLFAVGRNEEAARFSGINTSLVIASSYVVSALMAGIGAILLAFYTNSISPSSHGNFYELYAIAAAVLGGCSLRGGEGSVIGICYRRRTAAGFAESCQPVRYSKLAEFRGDGDSNFNRRHNRPDSRQTKGKKLITGL